MFRGDIERMEGETSDRLTELFSELFSLRPYAFQERVARLLLDRRSVILQAPTGSGKTKAALFPYLVARARDRDFPRRLLYCVPMRVLARSFYEDLRGHGRLNLDARLQTGEQQGDRRLEGDIVFATIDQILSSFLNIPYSLSLRQGNLNAGAVVSSYLVLDEFHLLDPASTLRTTLEMLRMLSGIAPFLLMTATFSCEMLGRLAALLDAEIVTPDQSELRGIPSQSNKKRLFHRVDSALTADAVLEHHKGRSIAICNTVERAQRLYEDLKGELGCGGNRATRAVLLHSRFLKSDRRQKEDEVRRVLGKGGDRTKDFILVATQVIEVGLDITCDAMHTEVAPASAVLQRAGRCARFEGECGDVYVYAIPPGPSGRPDYGPYVGVQCDLTRKTWEALLLFDGRNMDFAAEQELVDQVHAEDDRDAIAALEQASYAHRTQMERAIDRQELGLARELIRADDSVRLLVHPEPKMLDDPYGLEGFSLFFGTLRAQYKAWVAEGLPNEEVSWLLQYPKEAAEAEENDRPVRFDWREVRSKADLALSYVFCLNPSLARYDSELGFRFAVGDGCVVPLEPVEKPERPRHVRFRKETYQEHVERMLDIYAQKSWKEIAYGAARLESKLGLGKGAVSWAAQIAIACHDVGKMGRRWQSWARQWQLRVGAPVEDGEILAHTDYDSSNPLHEAVEQAMQDRRPPHAVEGAVATLKVLHQLLGGPGPGDSGLTLLKAAFSAIARHHSPRASAYQDFELDPQALSALNDVLSRLLPGCNAVGALQTRKNCQPVTGLLVTPGVAGELLAYFLIVRVLRLADQEAAGGGTG